MANKIRELPKGYSDTPMIPGQVWRVHDIDRPSPPVVTPGKSSQQNSAGKAPSDAIVLFDGSSTDAWLSVKGSECEWLLTDEQALEVKPGSGDIRSKQSFGQCQLHVEWRAPTEIYADSQGRGNSGVFLLGLYEIQVLDGYENPTYADGLTAAIYGQYPPLVNASVPPGHWHTFDIVFEPPVFYSSRFISPARLTVFHNGILVHLRQEIQGPTKHRALANYEEPHETTGPIVLQDHGDHVQFRNIWIREIENLEAE